jgi:hypothetical protein
MIHNLMAGLSIRSSTWYNASLSMDCVYETEATPSEKGHKYIDTSADIKWVLREERVWD